MFIHCLEFAKFVMLGFLDESDGYKSDLGGIPFFLKSADA